MAEGSRRDFQNRQHNPDRQRQGVYHGNQRHQYDGSQGYRHDHYDNTYSHGGYNEGGGRYYKQGSHSMGREPNAGHQKGRDGFRSPTRNSERTQWQRNQQDQNQMDWDQQSSRGSRHRRDEDPDKHLSKTLSFLLRHGAERAGFTLMPGGFLYVDDILRQQRSLDSYTIKDVIRIVETNDKQRFALQKDENGRLKIRANQGHSIEVEDLDLTPVTKAEEFPVVIHGTYFSSWDIIKEQGLSRMKRNHIHFSIGEPGENGVISEIHSPLDNLFSKILNLMLGNGIHSPSFFTDRRGDVSMRSSCEVMIFIDLHKALQDGIKFFKSANNVILSPGDKTGIIYPKYFQVVLQRYPRQRLEFDPTISEGTGGGVEHGKKRKKKNKRKQKDDKKEADSKPRESRSTSSKEDDSMEVETGVGALFNDSNDRAEMDVDNEGDIDKSESTPESMKSAPETLESTPETLESAPDTCPETWEDAEDMHADGNDEDVIFEEEYEIKELLNKDDSICEVNAILNSALPIAVCCYGSGLENPGGEIKKIVCATEKQVSVFHVYKDETIMHTGRLLELLTSRQPTKVLHNCAESSRALFDQFEVLLDGADLFDTKVIYDVMQEQGLGNLDDLKNVGFTPEKWKERVEDFNEGNQIEEKDKTLALLKGHKIMLGWLGDRVKKLKKDIYDTANSLIDADKLADHKKKMKKSREEKKKKEKAPEKESENKQKKKKK